MKHNLLIEFGPCSSEELRNYWEAQCEGLVEANAHWFADNPEKMDGPFPRYEAPRDVKVGNRRFADQALGGAPAILGRGRATCFDWCAFVAGLMRCKAAKGMPGGDANACVTLIPVADAYGRTLDFSYHALVKLSNGEILDATLDLPGYQGTDEWWSDHGHCCPDCALGTHEVEEQPCEECEVAQAAGCSTGTCGLKARAEKFRRR